MDMALAATRSRSTIKRSLEQILECPICQERLRDARLLKCGHFVLQGVLEKDMWHPSQAFGKIMDMR